MLPNNVKSFVSEEEYNKHKKEIDKAIQLRKNGEQVLMHSTELLSVLPPQSDFDIRNMPHADSSIASASEEKGSHLPLSEFEVTVKARWYSSHEKASQGSKGANIFDINNGTFELTTVVDTLVVPTVDVSRISPEDLKKYRVSWANQQNPVIKNFNSLSNNMYCITYHYDKNHLSQYTMQPHLGGGFGIEFHDHPHAFRPMSKECGGAAIIGRCESVDQDTRIGTYKFISVGVSYPDAIAIEGGVIHGNAAFVGPYAIATSPSTHAAITIVTKPNGELQSVLQPNYVAKAHHSGHPSGLFASADEKIAAKSQSPAPQIRSKL